MEKTKSSFKKTLITNLCLVGIIACVYVAAFTPIGASLFSPGPVLKGNTGKKIVALQISVDDGSDIAGYMDRLDAFGVKATFFFCEQRLDDNEEKVWMVSSADHGVGYYSCNQSTDVAQTMYIGGGYSVPVMNYTRGDQIKEVCASIDMVKLTTKENWQQVFADSISGDMFIYLRADNNFEDFEKIVQIVLDKGYTILKVDEML